MIIATFQEDQTKTYTKSVYQFDKGQKLIVTGVALPNSYEVHMSNQPESSVAYSCKGDLEGVYIPDALFISGDYIYVWLYKSETNTGTSTAGYDYDSEEDTIHEVKKGEYTIDEGKTLYEIVIPVIRRPAQLPTVVMDSTGKFGYIVENEILTPVEQ